MENEQSEHNLNMSDKDALEHLKVLMEFTTSKSLRKSLTTTFFTFLEDESERGQSVRFKEIVQDYFFLLEFLDKLDSK